MRSSLINPKLRLVICCIMMIALIAAIASPVFAESEKTDTSSAIDAVVDPVVKLINSFLTPLLAIVGALGTIYCVFLGIKFAKAEEPQDREKAKTALKNGIIGFVLIFVLMLALKLLMPVMIDWVQDNQTSTTK